MQTTPGAALGLTLSLWLIAGGDGANVDAGRDPQTGRKVDVARLDVRGRRLTRIRTLAASGGRLDWSAARNLIAFDRLGDDGYYDLFVMEPGGGGERCLTCGADGVPQGHNGNPAWHPSGDYLVFQSESQPARRGLLGRRGGRSQQQLGNPGSGFRNDLWITGPRGQRFVQLTHVGPQGAVLHPHFSEDGRTLAWAERLGSGNGPMGEWAIMLADFGVEDSRPRLENVRKFQPGGRRRFYETHGFFPDGKSLLFAGNPDRQTDYGFDIYRFYPATGQLTNLTNTPDEWDEHAQLSPDGSRIVWMSSEGVGVKDLSLTSVKSDYWMMRADGSNKERITWFNDPSAPEFLGSDWVVAADSAWSPDGKRLLVYVKTDKATNSGPLLMIEIE